MTGAEIKLILYALNLGTSIALDMLNKNVSDDEVLTDEKIKDLYLDMSAHELFDSLRSPDRETE